MNALVLILVAVTCQIPPPPSPGLSSNQHEKEKYVRSVTDPVPPPSDPEGQKQWLYAQLMVQLDFNNEAITKLKEKLDKMSPTEIGTLIQVYLQKRADQRKQLELRESLVTNNAQLNLQKAQAYRDHLKREYDAWLHVKKQEMELTRTAQQYFWANPGNPLYQYRGSSYGGYRNNWGGNNWGYGGWHPYGSIHHPYVVTPHGLRRY